jgi:uncharacterized protein YdhG (YjbR/CyaY superfamily)
MAEKRARAGTPAQGTSTSPKGGAPGTVDGYLRALPEEERGTLANLRALIRASTPKATESIAYRIPSYTYLGYLVGFGAQRNHLAFYVASPPLLEAHGSELAPWDTGNGGIRFPASRPLPEALVRRLVRARVAENEARAPQ